MKSLLAGILLLGVFSSTNATIIDNNTYTTDTTSGLDWLDLTASQNMSYSEVSSQFGVGGLYAGYTYATGAQIVSLVGQYTQYTGFQRSAWETEFEEGDNSIDGLVKLLTTNSTNTTYDPNAMHAARGVTADTYATGSHYIARIIDINESDVVNKDWLDLRLGGASPNYASPSVGSFLVRSISARVPEPSTIYLLAFGLLGLFGVVRRKV